MTVLISENGEYLNTAISFIDNHYQKGFPVDFFPQTGIMVMQDQIPVLIMPVYLEQSSSVLVAGHCLFNDNINNKIKNKALHEVCAEFPAIAKFFRKKYILTIWGRQSICRIANKYGFKNTDKVQEQIYIGEY